MKRMKRSEVVKIIAEALGQLPAPAYPVADQVLSRIEGPLGIDYDPVEEPLPERLEFQDYGDEWYIADADPSGQRFAGGAQVSSLRLSRNLSLNEKKRRVAEAVRRWNAWPELRREAEGLRQSLAKWRNDDPVADLIAILDGKEGE